MNKKILLIVGGVIVVALGIYAFSTYNAAAPAKAAFDPLNATYTVEGQSVTLVDGRAEMPAAPGSAAKTVTMIFGQLVLGDLNNDGLQDAAVLLTQNSGGSGTFYYAAVAVNTGSGAEGTNALLLGDRIAPQNIEINNGEAVANYAVRKPSEPMTATPSLGVSKFLALDGVTLSDKHPVAGPGEPCGGNMTTALACGAGYHCAPRVSTGHIPSGDVGGICVAD